MEELLKEMEEHKESMAAHAAQIMERIIRVNAGTQNETVRDVSNLLTGAHKSINTKIYLTELQINNLKKILSKEEA